MRSMRKRIILGMMCLLIFGSLCACGNPKNGDLEKINMACFPNITHAQALFMKGQGSLEKAFGDDVAVNWITFNAGPSEIEALFAGEVDIGYIGPVPAVSGYLQSSGDLYIIAGASNGGSVLIAGKDSDIYSAADLAERTVAIPQFGNTQHLSLLALLSANDLTPSTSGGSVHVVQSSNADIANLMAAGNIDAALVPEPWGSILEIRHEGRVVLDYDQVDPNGIPSTAVVIVRKDFLDAHPEAVEKFMAAHKEATDYINANSNEAMTIINEQISLITQQLIDTDILSSAFDRLEISWQIPISSVMDFAKIGVDENLFLKMPDEAIVFDRYTK
ncbi:MAG: aliphatic sulfonate ABC transporter substrate-binding protein [Lachnospiraceae bacterium]|nr:aliphatic sulfonate ABC transporter substrate-binding protein [Lachnospiraceae bacterium]